MKKLLLILSVCLLSSCYEDYVNDYDFAGIYFTNQTDVRSFIVGERMDFNLGAVLGGVLSNNEKRNVHFKIDPGLLTVETLEEMRSSKYAYIKEALEGVEALQLLPSDFYTLSNSEKTVIDKGKYAGIITVSGKDEFLHAPEKTIKANYALPLRIVSADADSIMKGKDYTVIGVKYECKLFGYYYHYGEWTSYDKNGLETGKEVIDFNLPMPDNTINELKTTAPYQIATSKAANVAGSSMYISINSDNTLELSAPEGAKYNIEAVGKCTYNNPKLLQDRMLILNYKISLDDGSYVVAKDTLAFRNRIRDGVNEWRDENPENYE